MTQKIYSSWDSVGEKRAGRSIPFYGYILFLLWYKFISSEEDAKLVSAQLLTNTRGYFSKA